MQHKFSENGPSLSDPVNGLFKRIAEGPGRVPANSYVPL